MAVTEATGRDGPDFSALPEGCIANIVSFTSPPDACRIASVSPVFKLACDSDVVWSSFLPPDCRSMASQSASSMKELYFSLCDHPVLICDGKMSLSLDRHSGKKCIMLSARALSITWGDTPRYWSWNHSPISRFAEVAELIRVCWLEIRGTISSCMLSPGTLYAAYLVFDASTSEGFELRPIEVGAGFAGAEVGKQERAAYVSRAMTARFGFQGRSPWFASAWLELCENGNFPKERRDGWSEIELGEFLTKDGEDGEVEMLFKETNGGNWKSGLVVEGIEIRPKDRK
ncbi:hypothetical protein EUGRSUZ_H02040 [Eucalyptus grandis]|uniref:Uncharacterized protein n=2 Tax=Eucalyptus grandis TaxID=71139 RepID=A0ACC3JQ31_EUCGR|nr:hypothetical protein EUGRSUZ_H02040 [Eucalyptus grandis]